MWAQTSQVWCGLIIVHSNRLFVLSALRLLPGPPPLLPSSNEISSCLQSWLRMSHCNSNWQRLSAQKSFRSPLQQSATTLKTCLAVWFQLGVKLSFTSKQRHIPSSTNAAPPLLCPIASLPCSKALSSFNKRRMGKQAVWGPQLLTGFIDWVKKNKQQWQTQKQSGGAKKTLF